MTERKPREISFTSWIDRQINEAQDRGEFDNLPGAGKPLPRGALSADAWLRGYLDREGVSSEAMLPVPLRLRKEAERLPDALGELRSEEDVREVVKDLNRRILEWRRIPEGPPIYLRLVNEEDMVARWRETRARPAAPAPPGPQPQSPPPGPQPQPPPAASRRWWRRRRDRTA
jgi:DnaJ-like protein